MPAKKKRKRNASTSSGLPADPAWMKAAAGMRVVKRGGKVILQRKKNGRNVAAGFYDEDGYFHPIRASFDYSASRAGEGKKKKNPRGKKKRIPWQKVVYAGAKGRPNKVKKKKATAGNPSKSLRNKLAKMKPHTWYNTKLSGVKMKVQRRGKMLILRPPMKRSK